MILFHKAFRAGGSWSEGGVYLCLGVFWQLVLVIAFIVLPYDIGAEM